MTSMADPHTVAREAYRLWRDRGITPDAVFDAYLSAEGYTVEWGNLPYRRAYRTLVDAGCEVAWPALGRDRRICLHCGKVLTEPGWYCSESCGRREVEGRHGARLERAA